MPRIAISEEAYMALKAEKKEEESFSDVILRLLPRGDPRRILAYIRTHELRRGNGSKRTKSQRRY